MQSDADEHSPDPEREFRKLVLALAHEAGFRLNFALFRSRPFRDQYVARLRQELAAQKSSSRPRTCTTRRGPCS